jgi:hypothetical protein
MLKSKTFRETEKLASHTGAETVVSLPRQGKQDKTLLRADI